MNLFLLTFILCKMTNQTNQTNQQLIEQYGPIVYFHKEEKYLPLDINIILQNSTLKDFTTDQVITSPSNRELYDFAKSHDFKPIGNGNVVLSIDKSLYNHSYLLQDQPIYAIVREKEGKTYITYIIVFPYNGDYNILRHGKAGSHPGDLEHYTVELDKDKNLTRVHFSAHGYQDGRWVSKDQVQFEHGRIVVFSALNGHGLYHKDGMAFRIGGLANDYLERGPRWNPQVNEIFARTNPNFNIDTMGWTVYNGRIGGELVKGNKDGIVGLIDKVWYGPNGELIDEFDPKKLNSPPFITETNAKILLVLKDIMLFVFLYFLSYYTLKVSKHYLKGHPEFMVHLTTIASLLFIFYIYRKIAYQLITKYSPQ